VGYGVSMMNDKLVIFTICLVAISFVAPQAFAFDPQVFDITLNEAQTQTFAGYEVVTLDFSLTNGGSEDIPLSGYSTIFLNDTNADYWEAINYRDFGFTETQCPSLDSLALANSTTNIKLCFLTTDEANLGYSLVIEDNDYFVDNQAKELVLESVPDWFKTSAASWCSNAITESQFITIVETNIGDGNINVMRGQSGDDLGASSPAWVKSNACLWSTDQISEYEFLDSIYWYIDNGQIQLN
jgi:hypothetical protein